MVPNGIIVLVYTGTGIHVSSFWQLVPGTVHSKNDAFASFSFVNGNQKKTCTSATTRTRSIIMVTTNNSSTTPTPSSSPPRKKPRRSSRRNKGTVRLAELIVANSNKNNSDTKIVLFITGAGLSVASGIRPFRSSSTTNKRDSAIWSQVIWKTATRQAFRKDPLKWYNTFWLPYFASHDTNNNTLYQPNAGHDAIATLQQLFPNNIYVITQNVDGLQQQVPNQPANLVECHGRVGLYKCIPLEDSDTDDDDDDDDDRPVHLGHRRKQRVRQQEQLASKCPYQQLESIPVSKIEPPMIRQLLMTATTTTKLPSSPLCPHCGTPCPPQALLFDEGYHSHEFYQYQVMEEWISKATAIVFVGTSFAVTITDVALKHAKRNGLQVFNFNTQDTLQPSETLHVENIIGPSHETLVQLVDTIQTMLLSE